MGMSNTAFTRMMGQFERSREGVLKSTGLSPAVMPEPRRGAKRTLDQVNPDEITAKWSVHRGNNGFTGHGGVNMDSDADSWRNMSADEASRFCIDTGAAGFTYKHSTRQVWRLKQIYDVESFVKDTRFD